MKKLYAEFRKWPSKPLLEKDGIVVASDITQEWILPWWWKHFSHHNNLPVAFVDFGMSEKMKDWCKEKGILVPLPIANIFVAEREEVTDSQIALWETSYGKTFWDNRNAWFKKPLACLQSPFSRSIWIDIDCEIRGPIGHLFELCENPSGLSIAKEPNEQTHTKNKEIYNSGVIVFKHGAPVFEKWADEAIENNQVHIGDQDALSMLISKDKLPINILSNLYNWSRIHKPPSDMVIYHLHGKPGKAMISHAIAKENLKDQGFPTDSAF